MRACSEFFNYSFHRATWRLWHSLVYSPHPFQTTRSARRVSHLSSAFSFFFALWISPVVCISHTSASFGSSSSAAAASAAVVCLFDSAWLGSALLSFCLSISTAEHRYRVTVLEILSMLPIFHVVPSRILLATALVLLPWCFVLYISLTIC